MLAALCFARNRITHELDEVGYVFATAKRPDGCAAAWTRRSLPPRPGQRQAVLHGDYERAIAGRDVVKTLSSSRCSWGRPEQDVAELREK